ncbi:MAG: DUF4412 domain-containing protein [Acidobacteriota bacterium]
MKKLILVLTLVFFTFTLLTADINIKTKNHTDAANIMGKQQPAKDEIVEQWVGDGIYTNITAKQSVIIDLKKKMMYMLLHNDKTYVETTLPLDMKKLLPEQVVQMMGMMKVKISVTETAEKKTIKGWKCTGYDMEMNVMMMSIKSRLWVTQDVPFDWKKFQEQMGLETFKLAMAQMEMSEDALNEFKKIKGFQVASELTMNIMGQNVKSTTEVLEITKKPAPAGIYEVPADYKKSSKLSMGQLRK